MTREPQGGPDDAQDWHPDHLDPETGAWLWEGPQVVLCPDGAFPATTTEPWAGFMASQGFEWEATHGEWVPNPVI